MCVQHTFYFLFLFELYTDFSHQSLTTIYLCDIFGSSYGEYVFCCWCVFTFASLFSLSLRIHPESFHRSLCLCLFVPTHSGSYIDMYTIIVRIRIPKDLFQPKRFDSWLFDPKPSLSFFSSFFRLLFHICHALWKWEFPNHISHSSQCIQIHSSNRSVCLYDSLCVCVCVCLRCLRTTIEQKNRNTEDRIDFYLYTIIDHIENVLLNITEAQIASMHHT